MDADNETPRSSTPTPTRGVPVELDRVRHLRYTLGTLRRIREELGSDALSAGVSEEKLAMVLWFGLKDDDPTLKVEDVENIIDLQQLPALTEALGKAMGGTARATLKNDPQAPASGKTEAEPSAGS